MFPEVESRDCKVDGHNMYPITFVQIAAVLVKVDSGQSISGCYDCGHVEVR